MRAAMDRTEKDHYHMLSVGEAGKDVDTLNQVSGVLNTGAGICWGEERSCLSYCQLLQIACHAMDNDDFICFRMHK